MRVAKWIQEIAVRRHNRQANLLPTIIVAQQLQTAAPHLSNQIGKFVRQAIQYISFLFYLFFHFVMLLISFDIIISIKMSATDTVFVVKQRIANEFIIEWVEYYDDITK